jgi:hypothetical protein
MRDKKRVVGNMLRGPVPRKAGRHLYSRQLWPHLLQVANFVIGSSAERVCISWKQASLALHFGHIICVVRCRLGVGTVERNDEWGKTVVGA